MTLRKHSAVEFLLSVARFCHLKVCDGRYRFEKRCANLATIDLNTLLFKYEVDIATAIRDVFDDELEHEHDYTVSAFPFGSEVPPEADAPTTAQQNSKAAPPQTSAEWFARAQRRKQLIDHYLWNEGKGLFFDYDTVKKRQSVYESVTSFWALWCGCATDEQAAKLVYVCVSDCARIGLTACL